MKQYKIAVFVGSLRQESLNKKLALALAKMFPENFQLKLVELKNLPLFNQDTELEPIPAVVEFKQAVQEADGFLFFTAEYNRSIPAVLKNALDTGSRPPSAGVWGGKPAAIGGISPGAMGTCMAQQHLRNVLSFLNVPTMSQPELYLHYSEGLFDAAGGIGIERSEKFLQTWVDQCVVWFESRA